MTERKKHLNVGIIGAGGIARTHANYYKKIRDVDVLAACDPSDAALKQFVEAFPSAKGFPDRHAMFKAVDLDAVSVCTPNGLHAEHTIDALDHGCHVMVEKPMAMTVAEAERMIEAAKRNDRKLVIGFQHRFSNQVRALRRAYDEGVFGKILFTRVQALRRRGIPNWGVFGRKDLQGGGPLIDIGVHALEMAHYAIGQPPPAAAVGSTWTYLGNRPGNVLCSWPNWDHTTYTVEDLTVGHIRLRDGGVMHIEAAFAAHIERDLWTFTFMGEKGGATLDPFAVFKDDMGMMVNCTPAYMPPVDIFDAKMRNFVDVCLNGRPSLAPAEDGLAVQKMLNGIYDSAEQGGREVLIG